MRAWTWFGGREVVVGVLAAAAFVALPTGLPLSEVLARWVPGLDGHGAALTVAVTAAVWACLSAWLLAGAQAQLARIRQIHNEVAVGAAGGAVAPIGPALPPVIAPRPAAGTQVTRRRRLATANIAAPAAPAA
jgi:hypothetical protein